MAGSEVDLVADSVVDSVVGLAAVWAAARLPAEAAFALEGGSSGPGLPRFLSKLAHSGDIAYYLERAATAVQSVYRFAPSILIVSLF